jgi:heme-degrading monooxygenase HmoA
MFGGPASTRRAQARPVRPVHGVILARVAARRDRRVAKRQTGAMTTASSPSRPADGPVLELAVFTVAPGAEAGFAAAFAQAKSLLTENPGCRSARLTQGVESPSRFVLLVEWDTLDAHLVGFRESPAFGRWRELLGPFFAAPPDVEHYTDLPA